MAILFCFWNFVYAEGLAWKFVNLTKGWSHKTGGPFGNSLKHGAPVNPFTWPLHIDGKDKRKKHMSLALEVFFTYAMNLNCFVEGLWWIALHWIQRVE